MNSRSTEFMRYGWCSRVVGICMRTTTKQWAANSPQGIPCAHEDESTPVHAYSSPRENSGPRHPSREAKGTYANAAGNMEHKVKRGYQRYAVTSSLPKNMFRDVRDAQSLSPRIVVRPQRDNFYIFCTGSYISRKRWSWNHMSKKNVADAPQSPALAGMP